MRLFYQAWPSDHISQTPSAKSPLPRIPQTSSAISPSDEISKALSRNSVDPSELAKAFPLPWSAYVRLLAVRNEMARKFYEIEALRCGWSVRQKWVVRSGEHVKCLI